MKNLILLLLIFPIISFSQNEIKVRKKLPKIYYGNTYNIIGDTVFTSDIQSLLLNIDTSNYKIISFELSKTIRGNYISSGKINGNRIDKKNHNTFVLQNREVPTKVESILIKNLSTNEILKLPAFYIKVTR